MQQQVETILEEMSEVEKLEYAKAAIKRGEKIGFFSDRDDRYFYSPIMIQSPKLAGGWSSPKTILIQCPKGGLNYEVKASEIYLIGDLLDERVDEDFNNGF